MTEHIDRGLKKMGITISKPFLAILCIISGILIILFKSSRMDSWTVSVDSRNTLADRVHRTREITQPRTLAIFPRCSC